MPLIIKQDKQINNQFLKNGLVVDRLYDDDICIGICKRKISENCLWIDMLSIDFEFQKKKYGRGFIKEYESIANKYRYNKIECKPILESIGFWKKVGFKKVRRKLIISKFPPRLTDKIYRKKLY